MQVALSHPATPPAPNAIVTFDRSLVDVGIGVTGALLLSQFLMLSKACANEDGWFNARGMDLQESTGLTRMQQLTVRKKLVELRVLQEYRKGIPPLLYFHIDLERLAELRSAITVA